MPDKYRTFRELQQAEKENSDYRIVVHARHSDVAIVAPHGGAIEPGTSEIAREIAGQTLSLYIFEGLKTNHNRDLHITSTRFDEPQCVKLVESSHHVIAIHGERSAGEVVYLGGLDEIAGAQINQALAVAGIVVKAHSNPSLQGKDCSNICNRGRSGVGVQLEISRGLRMSFSGRSKSRQALKDFGLAIRKALGLE